VKEIYQQSNCKHISLLNGFILSSIGGNTFFNNSIVGDNELYLNFFTRKEEIYFYSESKLYKYDGEQFAGCFSKKGALVILMFGKNNFFCYGQREGKEQNLSLLDASSRVLWEINTDKFYDILGCDLFFVTERFDSTKFSIYDKNNLQFWHYALPKGYEIYIRPKAIENVLFFTAYDENRKNQLVTGLNIFTGKVLWQNTYRVTNENKFISAHEFNSKDNLYYGFGHVFQIFNPQTGEIVFEKTFDKTMEHQLLPYIQSVYDNKLWFVSGRCEEVKFGYVNLNNYQIELLQDFPQENDEVFDTPIFHEGKLYLRGKFYNTLHVFE
jgi:outer membrane protein assembly factor BamB